MPKTAIKSKKAAPKKTEVKSKAKSVKLKKDKYIEGIGRRKTAVARVRIYPGEKKENFTINDLTLKEYFPTERQRQTVRSPFEVTGAEFKVTVKVGGSGKNAQTEAVRLGLSRALIKANETWRGKLKKFGYLTRDSRKVERKKAGLRKARRPQQWRKR